MPHLEVVPAESVRSLERTAASKGRVPACEFAGVRLVALEDISGPLAVDARLRVGAAARVHELCTQAAADHAARSLEMSLALRLARRDAHSLSRLAEYALAKRRISRTYHG